MRFTERSLSGKFVSSGFIARDEGEGECTCGIGVPVGVEGKRVCCWSTGKSESELFVGKWWIVAGWSCEEEREVQEEGGYEEGELHLKNLRFGNCVYCCGKSFVAIREWMITKS